MYLEIQAYTTGKLLRKTGQISGLFLNSLTLLVVARSSNESYRLLCWVFSHV